MFFTKENKDKIYNEYCNLIYNEDFLKKNKIRNRLIDSDIYIIDCIICFNKKAEYASISCCQKILCLDCIKSNSEPKYPICKYVGNTSYRDDIIYDDNNIYEIQNEKYMRIYETKYDNIKYIKNYGYSMD